MSFSLRWTFKYKQESKGKPQLLMKSFLMSLNLTKGWASLFFDHHRIIAVYASYCVNFTLLLWTCIDLLFPPTAPKPFFGWTISPFLFSTMWCGWNLLLHCFHVEHETIHYLAFSPTPPIWVLIFCLGKTWSNSGPWSIRDIQWGFKNGSLHYLPKELQEDIPSLS